MNPLLTKNYVAAAAIGAYLFVKLGAADGQAEQASAAADAIVGATGTLGADAAGARVDVVHGGIAEVTLGGAVTRGDLVTADADGQAVTAAAGNRTGGIALASGVAGDVVPVLLQFGVA